MKFCNYYIFKLDINMQLPKCSTYIGFVLNQIVHLSVL